MGEIIINQDFEEDFSLFEEGKDMEFDSSEILELKKEAQSMKSDEEVDDLLTYNQIKKNLAYDLPHQREGAIRLLKELNATALLADEVGLGKTITTGFVLKEGIVRGFIKKCVI